MSGWNVWDADSIWERRAAIKAQDLKFCRAMRRAHPELATAATPPRIAGRKAPRPSAARAAENASAGCLSILTEIAKKHGVTLTELCGSQRSRQQVLARHEAMYRLRAETPMSLLAIGERLGRDHSSVIYGIAQHNARLAAT